MYRPATLVISPTPAVAVAGSTPRCVAAVTASAALARFQ